MRFRPQRPGKYLMRWSHGPKEKTTWFEVEIKEENKMLYVHFGANYSTLLAVCVAGGAEFCRKK